MMNNLDYMTEYIATIKDRKILKKIKKIIIKYNPDVVFTITGDSTLTYFHNLHKKTYEEIQIIIDKHKEEHISSQTKINNIIINKSSNDNLTYNKLKNSENKIIKRINYAKNLTHIANENRESMANEK